MNAKLSIIIILLCFMACNKPASKQTHAQNVQQITSMQELCTVEAQIVKIIKASDTKKWYKLGDRKILMRCKAGIRYGINLKNLKEENIKINGSDVTLWLPHATLLSLNLPPQNFELVYEEVGILRTSFTTEERNELQTQAQKNIEQAINSKGFGPEAEKNATLFFASWFKNLGYSQTKVIFTDEAPGIIEAPKN